MPVSSAWRCFCRLFQATLYVASFVMPWRRPFLLKGANCIAQLPALIQSKHLKHALLVTDMGIMKMKLADAFIEAMGKAGVHITIFKEVTPNPTVDQIEAALQVFTANRCDHIVAFGGGSPMDCAKVVGARSVRPRTPIRWMKGLFGVMWKLPPLFAIPTTAGTGSECTLAAVVSDPRTHEKYSLVDPFLFPPYAVLDPQLTVDLPPFVTATTGMDALTHAVEAYLNIFHVRQADDDAIRTVELVFANLLEAYRNGTNITARESMQEAAYLGGLAFGRVYVGNVHALAHTLGGFYNVPHGLANAVLLPHVLEAYGPIVYPRLAVLGKAAGIQGGTEAEVGRGFISAIRELNAAMKIPTRLSEGGAYSIKEEDLSRMAHRALSEANPLYPVPVIFGEEEMVSILRSIM